jgi:transmembrane sensor
MSELARRMAHASQLVEPAWDTERESRVRAGVGRGLERARRKRVGLVVVAGACTLLFGFLLGRQPTTTTRMALPPSTAPSLLELPDGSSVNAGSRDARVETVAVGPEDVTLRLDSGQARFSVTPNPQRPFRVIARDVTVTVLGTIFSVALEPHGVRVAVERGRVRVDAPHVTRELTVGETADFESSPTAPPETVVDPLPPLEATSGPSTRPATGPSWRTLAKDQSYGAALTRLTAEGPNAVRDTPDDLLLAADVARLGGRPDRAVAPLKRVISDHAFDPRAPLAAFTLGRTLLEQLGRPREAAQAFATARRLDRGGALTQDALAREVESWAGAGEAERAHARALEYVKLYPQGRRVAAVRRLGGLD